MTLIDNTRSDVPAAGAWSAASARGVTCASRPTAASSPTTAAARARASAAARTATRAPTATYGVAVLAITPSTPNRNPATWNSAQAAHGTTRNQASRRRARRLSRLGVAMTPPTSMTSDSTTLLPLCS
ncbi:hypothetical protein Aple_092950 [Acrocarpospora pleiomorpha]|uniref:Uncharacterized protein n=1 Tax=Acrocarpospora pleiomorpha TaxID=90975 RepID=A0A5M3XZN6_9ACTN|nr:hypothetical protein Aple_092950 [Acrocarpospora pleiomorpha]